MDSGRTLSRLSELLRHRNAHSVRAVTLLDKPSRREVPFQPDFCGAEVPDEFVVGYGLDYCQQYRNMPYIGVLKPEVYSEVIPIRQRGSEGRSIAVEEHEKRPVGASAWPRSPGAASGTTGDI